MGSGKLYEVGNFKADGCSGTCILREDLDNVIRPGRSIDGAGERSRSEKACFDTQNLKIVRYVAFAVYLHTILASPSPLGSSTFVLVLGTNLLHYIIMTDTTQQANTS